jgi:hypothetical protein
METYFPLPICQGFSSFSPINERKVRAVPDTLVEDVQRPRPETRRKDVKHRGMPAPNKLCLEIIPIHY